MIKNRSGFTIVELLVVVAVIGVLSTIGIFGFSRYQTTNRDTQRSSKATIIAEALEKYYEINGEYPSCLAVSNANVATVTTTVLPGVDPNVLLTPKSVASDANSVECMDLTGASGEADVFAYIGDGSTACASGQSCLEFTLKYIDEETGEVKIIESRHRTSIATAGTTNLSASTVGFTQINASWAVINNAATYELQRATNSGFTANPVSQTVTGTSASVTGLSFNTSYYFRIRPLATDTQGDWSNTVNASTWTLTQPTATATAQSFTQINTSWGAISHAASYEIQRATNSGFTTGLVTQTATGTTSNFTGLAFNTTYYFRVRALGGGFSGAWSTTDTESTWGLSTPSTSATAISSTNFTTTWGAVPHAASYNVQCSSNGTTWSGCTGSTTALSYGWGPTSQGTPLYFRTQAVNGSYVSSWSNTATATTTIDAPAAFPLHYNNTLPNWNYLNVGSGAVCPAGTTLSSDWYANGAFWTRSGTSQSYGLSWNTSVTISVATKCETAYTNSAWTWASNTASMSLPWTSVVVTLPGDSVMYFSGSCPKWSTSHNYYYDTNGSLNHTGNTTAASYGPVGPWGNGNAHVTLSCMGPWGTASQEGTSSYGPGCVPTKTVAACYE